MADNQALDAEPFSRRLLLATLPLRQHKVTGSWDERALPVGWASGCIVRYRENPVLLTVAHAARTGAWSFDVRIDFDSYAKPGVIRQQIGTMQFALSLDLADPDPRKTAREAIVKGEGSGFVDFSFRALDPNQTKQHPVHTEFQRGSDGKVTTKSVTPRTIIETDFSTLPREGGTYGFHGYAAPKASDWTKGPDGVPVVSITTKCHEDLEYVARRNDYVIVFRSRDPKVWFDDSYKGCSGSPIMDEQGNLVSLVVGCPDKGGRELFGLDLARVRGGIHAELDMTGRLKPA